LGEVFFKHDNIRKIKQTKKEVQSNEMGEITLDHVETNESWKEKNEKWDIAQV